MCICALASGKGKTGVGCFHVSGGLACQFSHLVSIEAKGGNLGLPSRLLPLPRWLFLHGFYVREDLFAPKPPAQDQQRQLRVEFYWARMTRDDLKAMAACQAHWNLFVRKPSISKTTAAEALRNADTSNKPINNEKCKSIPTPEKPKPTLSTCSLQEGWPTAGLLL